MEELGGYFVAGGIAGAVAACELISRYRDRPRDLLHAASAWFYLLLNVLAGCAALFSIRSLGWDFGADDGDAGAFVRVLVAGFGSMALFRSSLFNVRLGGEDVPIGPATVTALALDAADRGVDRFQARRRANLVAKVMSGISFDRSREVLPSYTINLLEGLRSDAQRRLAEEVDELDKSSTMSERVRVQALGLAVMRASGADVFQTAVKFLHSEICERRTCERRSGDDRRSRTVVDLSAVSAERRERQDRRAHQRRADDVVAPV